MSSIKDSSLHAEKRIDRFKPGTTHPIFGSIPTKGVIPLPDTKTGRIYTSLYKVLGVGTQFLSEINQGDHVYYNGSARRVAHVISDTLMLLEYAFPVTLTNEQLKMPPRNKYSMMVIKSTNTSTDAILEETTFAAGELTVTGGAPVTYDVSGGGALEFTCSL